MRRVSWIVMRRTPYRAHRASKARLMFRGSIGWPVRVVNTSACFSPQMQVFGQSAVRAWSWLRFAIRSAVTPIGGLLLLAGWASLAFAAFRLKAG